MVRFAADVLLQTSAASSMLCQRPRIRCALSRSRESETVRIAPLRAPTPRTLRESSCQVSEFPSIRGQAGSLPATGKLFGEGSPDHPNRSPPTLSMPQCRSSTSAAIASALFDHASKPRAFFRQELIFAAWRGRRYSGNRLLQEGLSSHEGPYLVFTAAYHLKRGYCCNSNCRHWSYK